MMMVMMMFAKRKICPMIRSPHTRFFSPGSAPKTPNFIVSDYLVASLGLSPDKAAKVSKRLTHLKSADKPDAVLRFLINAGFSESHAIKLITSFPDILCCSPEKTLDPNMRAIRDLGLSTPALNQIILSGPKALQLRSAVPRIRFWMDYFDHDEPALVTAFKQNAGLVGHDIGRVVSPKISLLRSQGFSNYDIQRIVCAVPRFITSRIGRMEDLLRRTEELGFQPGSGTFLRGLHAMLYNTRDMLEKKMDLFKSFGWSENELLSAVLKSPGLLTLSEENLQAKMDFLLGEARCASSYINSHPVVLTYSLERRLRPRNDVMRLLESKDIYVKGRDFVSAIQLTNNQFVDKYIIPHKDEISGLQETYLSACA